MPSAGSVRPCPMIAPGLAGRVSMATSQFTSTAKFGPRPTVNRTMPRKSGVTRCFCMRASISIWGGRKAIRSLRWSGVTATRAGLASTAASSRPVSARSASMRPIVARSPNSASWKAMPRRITGGNGSWLSTTAKPPALRCTATAEAISLVPSTSASGCGAGGVTGQRKLVCMVGPGRMPGGKASLGPSLGALVYMHGINILDRKGVRAGRGRWSGYAILSRI